MRRKLVVAACLAFLAASPAATQADWPPGGVSLCSNCDAGTVLICPDGEGGAFVAWYRFSRDVSLQRVTATGEIAAGWPPEGVPACIEPASQYINSITPDGLGGVFVAWQDFRNSGSGGTTGTDIYVHRVQRDGTLAPGWAVNGMPATRKDGHQTRPQILADGTGGVYVAWDDATLTDVSLQRMTASGGIAPGWPADGLAVCTDPAVQELTQLTSDGAGGVFVAWGDQRDPQYAAYALRVLPDGSIASGWPVNGTRILLDRYIYEVMADGVGGAYLTGATAVPSGADDFFLQRFTGAGAIASGWPVGGAPVCQAPNYRSGIRVEPDGAGGVVLSWTDNRDSASDDEIFMLRMQSDGTRAPGWPLDGLRVTDNTVGDIATDLAPDGLGGAYLCWDRYQSSVGDRTVLQHISGSGTRYPGWPANGYVIPSDVQTGGARITADGMGGAIVAWVRLEDDGVRALWLPPDGPVAVALSLESAEASADRVRLSWLAANAPSLRVDVERRDAAGEWQTLTSLTPDGTGRIAYEDRDVTPGARYAYRLSYLEPDGLLHTTETWVTVPKLELALQGFRPNPAAGEPQVAFALAESAPATLEVYDVAGRRVAAREVGGLGPGQHVVALEAREPLRAGVYAVRLVQGPRVLQTRGVVVR